MRESSSHWRVLVAGSRDYAALSEVDTFVVDLATRHSNAMVLDGGARGVDERAHYAAVRAGLRTSRLPAPWLLLPKYLAGHVRNAVLVARADEVVVFWDQRSRGTWSVILLARWLQVPCRVIVPSGEIDAATVSAWT